MAARRQRGFKKKEKVYILTIRSETNEEEVKKRLEMFKKRFLENSKTIIQEHSLLLIGHLRSKYMRGKVTTDTSIRKRSGELSNSMRPIIPVKATNQGIEGGITFGKIYAKMHIGPRGQVTTIRPKDKKYLTIPLPSMQTKAGVTRTTAAELMQGDTGLPFGQTFIKRSKAGNLIIFGTKRITKGANIGAYRGEIIPLFILKKKVEIKTRVHPEDFLKWSKEHLVKDFKKKGIEASITYG